MPLLKVLVGGLSPRKRGFDLVSFPVGFVVDRVALGHFFLRVLPSFPAGMIPSIIHAHLHVHVAVTLRKNGRRLGTFQTAVLFGKSGSFV